MVRLPNPVVAVVCAGWLGLTAQAAVFLVDNPAGSISIRVVNSEQARVTSNSPDREVRESDIQFAQQKGFALVRAQPEDGIRVDLEVEIPYGYEVRARTSSGSISVAGMVRRGELLTDSGEILLSAPWEATRVDIESQVEPGEVILPENTGFRQYSVGRKDEEPRWVLTDKHSDLKITYGRILIEAKRPAKLLLEDCPIPEDSPVKLPWQAAAAIEELLNPQKRSGPAEEPETDLVRPEVSDALTVEEGVPRFSSEVRMVNLTAAVFDEEGGPVTGLEGADFEVVEDGRPQEVAFAGTEAVPFNLVLLLDLSGSARRDRAAMIEAAKRFVDIARPEDRVAVYALAANLFQVVSPLTDDRERLKQLIDALPEVSGGTPLYDAITLAYMQELDARQGERNAIIVISDGLDNRVHGTGTESETSIKDLERASEAMNTLIYPVFLDPFTVVPAPGWAKKAKKNLEDLAHATGGRLFAAQSIRDLDPVYPQVADELRSLYSIAYYPSNQDFEGRWRRVEVRVNHPQATVRTRAGYYGN